MNRGRKPVGQLAQRLWARVQLAGLLAASALCAALVGCGTGSTFVGDGTLTADGFRMDYTLLDQQESAFLTLAEGDDLQVTIRQERGSVDVTVGMEGAEPVYEGNGLTEAAFTLHISAGGTYQLSVTGHAACGSVAFVRAEPKPEEQPEPKPDAQETGARYAAYQFALQQIAFEHVYPDGTDTGFDGAGAFIEDNHFAVFDINDDGADELIVQFVTAPMAGNRETVYAYNAAEDTLEQLLTVFPAVTYYDNGLVKADWSHGSALAGEAYWPYDLYQYDGAAGQYRKLAEVNMWSREVDTVDYKGDPYPEEIDAENAGTVFILTRDDVTETVSHSDYAAWLAEVVGDAQPVQVPYQSMSEENIRAICP